MKDERLLQTSDIDIMASTSGMLYLLSRIRGIKSGRIVLEHG